MPGQWLGRGCCLNRRRYGPRLGRCRNRHPLGVDQDRACRRDGNGPRGRVDIRCLPGQGHLRARNDLRLGHLLRVDVDRSPCGGRPAAKSSWLMAVTPMVRLT